MPVLGSAMRTLVVTGVVLSGIAIPQATREIRLVDVADRAGISFMHQFGSGGDHITESLGSGGAWIDYDVDGDIDLLLVNGLPTRLGDAADGSGHALFRNDGGRLSRVPVASGIEDRVWGGGIAVADVDNDGFPDVLITAVGPDRYYRNNGDGTFSATEVGVADPGWGTSTVFTDWDRDGFVDLYVARYAAVDLGTPRLLCFFQGMDVFCGPEGRESLPDLFYRNSGDGRFEPWFEDDIDPQGMPGLAVVATDCDDDLLPDIYIADDSRVNLLYRHTPSGGVEEWGLLGGTGYSGDGRAQAGMSATAGDVDGDGLFDLFVTNFQNDHNTLYHNLGDCTFEDVTSRYGLARGSYPYMGWGAQFVDFDGDADLDLFIANGQIYPELEGTGMERFAQRNLLYANQLRETGTARFVEIDRSIGGGVEEMASSRGLASGDYDNDGDTDLVVTNVNAQPTVLRNDGQMAAPALRLSLIGRTSNRSAYGARIRVDSGGITQLFELRGGEGYMTSNDPRILAFLPGATADEVEIIWPGGGRTTLRDQAPGWLVVDEERGIIARRAPRQ